MPASNVDIRARQAPIRQRYLDDPDNAVEVLSVHGGASDLADPVHVVVSPDSMPDVLFLSGAHPAVGGDGDVPCSGDLLLAALAACQETTLRMVAANMGIDLEELEVSVEADWDPRGTLAMGRDFPVGITAIRAHTRVVVRGDEREERARRLLHSAERYCVILQTLQAGVPVESTFALESL
ncbi:MAG TPA: OsmC family protein [Thermoleophilia bacterium]|nr:OsmC family protein [Thermoleophilia bacterium]